MNIVSRIILVIRYGNFQIFVIFVITIGVIIIIGSSLPIIALNSPNFLLSHNDNRSSSIPSISDGQSNNNSNKSNLIASGNHYSSTPNTHYIRTLNSIPGSKSTNDNLRITNSINNKLVILSFDDNRKGDFTYAKSILDKYGFKATLFIICGKTSDRGAMNWQDIAAMQKDGMDIESHTMTHAHLNTLSQSQLDFEIGGSKQCLTIHGYNSTIFAYPYNEGSNNPIVVNTVAKYYDMARSGAAPLMFLDCNGFVKHPQADCRTYTPEGKLTYANRYAIKSLSFDKIEIEDSFDNATMFYDFVKIVNSQNNYNHGGKINAIPLITFHNVALTNNHPYYTNAGMFDKFMKYLHDNGFKVLTLKQIWYDTNNNIFFIKDSHETRIVSITNNTATSSNILNTIHKTPFM
ncbi:MAG: polysaccharide deacetylase family protein [Candidatus Nitrosopolaris sp.]